MSDHEALMWALEDDPVLRSSFANVTITDQPIDVVRFRERMALTVQRVRRLRQRVVEPPGFAAPRWEDDAMFDLDFHVRHIALPPPGTERQLLDFAALASVDQFDRARPLWQFIVVDGLADGRGAMVQKLHHTISDGEASIRMSSNFLDLERDAREPLVDDEEEDATEPAMGGFSPADVVRRPLGMARRAVVETVAAVADPFGTPARAHEVVESVRSVVRQVAITSPACSPLWSARSLRRHLETLTLEIDDAKAAAKKLGGSVNDLFVTGAIAGAGAYHRARGVEVDQLRMAMPVSTRRDGHDGSNAFTPTRMMVPVGDMDPVARFEAVREIANRSRGERAVSIFPSLAGVVNALPPQLLLKAARQQVGTVDFTTSNVRGAPFDVYVAGAKILANYPIGPMAGTAFNLTTLSLAGSLDMGLCVDLAAVDDPGLLRTCIEEAYAELLGAAGVSIS
jgi:diacylglycerol O-acyltransferase / wax synthase